MILLPNRDLYQLEAINNFHHRSKVVLSFATLALVCFCGPELGGVKV